MTNNVGIDIVLRSQLAGASAAQRALNDVGRSADKATGATATLEKQMKSTSQAAQLLTRGMGGLFAVFGGREIIRMADSFQLVQGRLQNATRSTKEATQAFEGLRTIVQRTGSDMTTAVSIFQRLSFVRDQIDATVDDMLQFTDTVSKLGVVSGASTENLRAGLTQLGQSLSSNIVRAEEFNSIMENIPAVGVQIEKQFGLATGQLRQLVIEGEVLSEDVFAALLNSSEEVEAQFAKMPMTIGRAFNALRSDIEIFIGKSGEASGAVAGLIGVIDLLRLSVSGIGVAFDAVLSAMATSVNLMALGIENIINKAISSINFLITQANRLPGVDIGLFNKIDVTGGVSAMDILKEGATDLQGVFNQKGAENTFLDRMFGPEAESAAKASREISKNYKEIADSMGDSEGSKAAAKSYKELMSLIAGTRTEEERLIDTMKEMESLRGFAKNEKEVAALETALKRVGEQMDELKVKAELNSPMARAFQSLASEIDDGFKDAFKSAFQEGDGGFKGMLDGWKNTLKNFLAEMAYQAFARPIIVPLVGAVGGMMGLSTGAVNASILGSTGGQGSVGSLGSGGGGFGLDSLTSIGSSFLNGGLYSSTLGSFGSGVGNLLTGQAWGAMGPSAGAAIGAGAFGNLGYGALGGLGANLLGLGSDNAIVNFASGGLGALAGGAIGTSLGTILGFAGGPIGAIAGGFLGSALGGLFGGAKPSNKTQYGGLDLANLEQMNVGGMTGKKFSQANADFRDSVLGEAAGLAGLFQSVGGQTSGKLNITVGSRDGLWLFNEGQEVTGSGGNLGSNTRQNFGSNSAAFVEAVLQRIVDSTTGLSETFQTLLDKVGIQDTAKLAEAFDFGRIYESIVNPIDQAEEAIKAVNSQFDAMIEKAQEFGLSSDVFTQKVEEQRQAQLDLIKAQEAGFQSLEAMKNGFDAWMLGQSLSSTSSLSPIEKLMAAQGNFGGILSAVQGGETSRTNELLQAGQQLLQIGQSMYASSVDFSMLERFVRDSIGGVARQLGVEGYATGTRSATAGMRWVGEQGPELVRFNGGERVYNAEESKMMARQQAQTDARFGEMNNSISGMRQDINRLTRQMGRVANGIMATKVVTSV